MKSDTKINGTFSSMSKKILNKRILLLLLLFIAIKIFFYLDSLNILDIPIFLSKSVEIMVFTLITLIIISLIIRFTSRRVYMAFEGEVEIEQRIFLSKIYSFFLYMAGFALILWKIGVSTSNITLFLGLVTTGIAFAIRDVLMAIFAWFIVLRKQPFKIHDQIKIGDDAGEVTRIGTFFITLQTCKDSKNVVKIPNKMLLEKPIANYGKKRKLYLVKLPLSKVPDDISKRIETLKTKLKEFTVDKENVHVKLDSEGINWFLSISLTGDSFDENIHNIMITEGFIIFKDVAKKGKENEN